VGVRLKKIVHVMRRHFDVQEELREKVLELSREVIRASSRAIAAMHRGDPVTVRKEMSRANSSLSTLVKAAKKDPAWMDSGLVQSAYQEYCEARIVQALIAKGNFLGPKELKASYKAYLGGMADAAGELRRYALDSIRADKVEAAERALEHMEDILELLMSFDYPDAILPGMRRKQDMVRQVLERTRGDLTAAIRQQRLERALEHAKRRTK
jgi:translin